MSWITALRKFSGKINTRPELIAKLKEAKKRGVIDHDSLLMIEGVLKINNMQARDIMVPKPQMVMLEGDASPEKVLSIVNETQHSRFPVWGEKLDEIIGILLAKDLLRGLGKDSAQQFLVRDLVRPAFFVPESKKLNILLKEFRVNRNHMAIVVDEYGGIAGLVTIEDVLEEIVGEIADEYDLDDETESNIRKINENKYLVRAFTPIEEFNHYFNTHYQHDDFDTVGGWVLQKFGRLPKKEETTIIDHFKITIVKASNRGIQVLRIDKLNSPE